jgi:hypothetical protein
MEELGVSVVTPTLRDEDQDMTLLPWVDPADFNPGYLARMIDSLPRQGDRDPWRHASNYYEEREALPVADLDDGALRYV